MGAEHPSSPGTPTGQSVLDFGEFGGSEASDSLPLPPPAAAALGGHAPEGGSLAPATPGGRPLSAGLSSRSSSSPFAAAADALPQVEEEAEATEEAFLDALRLARISVGGKGGGARSRTLSFHGPPSAACQSTPVQVTAHLPEPRGQASRGADGSGSSSSSGSSCRSFPAPAADKQGGAAFPPHHHFGGYMPPRPPSTPAALGLDGVATAGPWDPAALAPQYQEQQEYQYQQQYNLDQQQQQQYNNLGWAPFGCGWAVTYYQQGPPPPLFILPPVGAAPPPYGCTHGYGPPPEEHRSQGGSRPASRMGRRLPRDPALGKLLGRFRQGLPPPSGGEWTLQSVRGELLDFACDAEVSRTWLQAVALRHAAPAELAEAFHTELRPWLLKLATHGSGNYVVQWFLTPDNFGPELLPEVAAAVNAAVAGRVVELSRHAFGCRVLQALLKVLDPEARVALALQLCGHTAKLASDLHASHCVRVCLETVTPSDPIRPLVEELVAELLRLCMDSHGCRLLPAVLAHCTIPELTEEVSEAVIRHSQALIRHRYGNYVVKALYAHGSPTDRAAIVAGVAPHAAELSLNKFASFFVDTLLEAGSPEESEAVARGLLLAPKALLARAMRDESGNYVVRHALERSSGELREALLAAVLDEVPELWESHYGKHVAQSATRLLGGSGPGQWGMLQ